MNIIYNVSRMMWIQRSLCQEVEFKTAAMPEQEHMRNVARAGLATRKSKTIFEEMLHAIEGSLSHLVTSDVDEDG
jgi:hypothetical protein